MGLAEDIAQHLDNNEYGTHGVDLFSGQMPPQPKACVAVLRTGGSTRDASGGETQEPRFQLLVRAVSYTDAEDKAADIADFLHNISELHINSNRYLAIYQTGDLNDIGPDENGLQKFSVNFRCYLQKGVV